MRPSGRRLFLARFIHFVISDERGSNPRIDIIFERTDGFHKFNVDSEWEEVSNGRDVTFDKSSMQKISLTSCPAEGFVVSSVRMSTRESFISSQTDEIEKHGRKKREEFSKEMKSFMRLVSRVFFPHGEHYDTNGFGMNIEKGKERKRMNDLFLFFCA